MIIGIDIDGVLTDFEQFQLDIMARDDNKIVGYDFKSLIKNKKKKAKFHLFKCLYKYITKGNARAGANDFSHKLQQDNNQIIIITSRFLTNSITYGLIMRGIVINWLAKEGISYDKIVYCSKNKEKAVKSNHVDVMIEDNPDNIKKLSKYCQIICMDATYNKKVRGKNITHVKNFNEAYKKIKQMANKPK